MKLHDWLQSYLQANKKRVYIAKALLSWSEVIGEKAATFSKAITLKPSGVLVVAVSETTGLTDLQYRQIEILEKYKKEFPKLTISKIYFKLDANLFPKSHLKKKSYPSFAKQPNKKEEKKEPMEKMSLDFSSWLKDDKEMQDKLANWKKAWALVKKRRQSLSLEAVEEQMEGRAQEKANTSVVGVTGREEVISTPASLEPSGEGSPKERLIFPQAFIHSVFLSQEDEFQPFDLY